MTAPDPVAWVKGAQRLVSIYGRWPSFRDAEVTSVRLDRGCPPVRGAVAHVAVHVFEAFREGGAIRFRNHAVATLRFAPVVDLSLSGFNHQNAIFDLTLEPATPATRAGEVVWEGPAYRVCFDPSFGIALSFVCGSVEVEAVDRGCPEGSVYA